MTLDKPTRRRLHRVRLTIEAVVAGVIITAALVVGLVGLFVPWFVNHPDTVRGFIEKQLKRPVTFDSLSGSWTVSGPVFALNGLTLGGEAPIKVGTAELAIDFYSFLKPNVSFSDFRIVGIEVDLAREPDGRWHVEGLGGQGTGGGGNNALAQLGSVSLKGAKLNVIDHARGRKLSISRVDAKLVNDLDGRRIGAVLWVGDDTPPLRAACALNEGNDGQCYFGGQDLEPARWLGAYPIAGIAPLAGTITAQVWLDVGDARATRVRTQVESPQLVLRGVEPVKFADGDAIEPRFSITQWDVDAQFLRQEDGWRLDAIESREGRATPTRFSFQSIAAACEPAASPCDRPPTLHFESPNVALADWLPFAALTNRPPAKARSFLYENAPSGTLRNVRLTKQGDAYSVEARVERVALRPGFKRPGFEFLSGDLRGDERGLVFNLDRDQPFTLDYRHMFRTPIAMTIRGGRIDAHPSEAGYRVEASGLDLDGDGYGATARVALTFDPVGTKPTLELTARVKPGTRVPQAKLFWPMNTMPPKAVRWLDRALVDGVLVDTVAVIRGDLDDWPFKREPVGRFEAVAEIAAATIDFKEGWPVARIESGTAQFINDAMHVEVAAGEISGLIVTDTTADIAHFKDAILELKATGEGTGENMMRFLRATPPVARKYGNQLIGVDVGGTGAIDVDLHLPLDDDIPDDQGGVPNLAGSVMLADADLADAKYDLAFQRANGRVRFSDDGFSADALDARLGGQPVELSISSGEFTSTPEHAAEASLRADVPASVLFAGYEMVEPFLPKLLGSSSWAVDLSVPKDVRDVPSARSTLRVRSDLVGTAIDFPAPLKKSADDRLPLDLTLQLPLPGGTLSAELGELMRVRARWPDAQKPLALAIAFGAQTTAELPASGTRVRGDVAAFDLSGWGGLAGAGGSGTTDVEMHAGELLLSGRAFEDVSLTYRPSQGGSRATVRGPQLAGAVDLAKDAAGKETITARFERLHFPDAPGDQAPKDETVVDPSTFPTLHFWAKDLKFGSANLGEARIEAFPVIDAKGRRYRFDEIETTAPNIAIHARGDWQLANGAERSDFDINFTAQSLGGMLDALGFEGIIEGGSTVARLKGAWPGSPAQFSLAKIDGTLEATVGKGRMLDVEPGAGRLFGLVSLQSIPRRLTLDFSDFFKSGLAFDSIVGTFKLDRGNAYTNDLLVKGPSADIRISGRTGLAARDYEQQMEVTPRVGGVLPVVGAIAAGPVGAAAGLFANVLPFGKALKTTYRVGGSWEKPDITVIARGRPGRAPRG